MHVKLFVDGERIRLNEFVEKFFGNTINGAIKSLSDIKENWVNIEVKVERRISNKIQEKE